MKITRTELSLLRLTDGIATAADIERLSKQFDEQTVEAWRTLSSQIGAVLKPVDSGESSIDVAPAVITKLGLVTEGKALDLKSFQQALSSNLDSAAKASLEESMVDSIMNTVLGVQNDTVEPLQTNEETDEPLIELNLEAIYDAPQKQLGQDEVVDSAGGIQGVNDKTSLVSNSTSSLDNLGPLPTDFDASPLMLDDWSHQKIIRSALMDSSSDLTNVVDTVLNVVLDDDANILRALEEELNNSESKVAPKADFDMSVDLDDGPNNSTTKVESFLKSSSDEQLLEGSEQELEDSGVAKPVVTPSSTASNMDFTAEIPSPTIADRAQFEEGNAFEEPLEFVVEFTEEEEFESHTLPMSSDERDEDSDDEVCSVEESFVSEQMLKNQAENFPLNLTKVLLYGESTPGAKDLDVWSAMSTLVGKPRLRILPETADITVVNKVPTPIVEKKVVADNSANVEFVSNNRIDADSTISKMSIIVLGSFLSVAAAWMVIVLPSLLTETTSTLNTPKRVVTFEVAEVNQLEVEDLEVGEDMNVQILQGDGNAPTIIFLDDMEAL